MSCCGSTERVFNIPTKEINYPALTNSTTPIDCNYYFVYWISFPEAVVIPTNYSRDKLRIFTNNYRSYATNPLLIPNLGGFNYSKNIAFKYNLHFKDA